MNETHTSVEWEKRVRAALSELKSAELPRDAAKFSALIHRLRSSKVGERAVAKLQKRKVSDGEDLVFLLALQADLLQQENRWLREQYILRRSPKREMANQCLDPLDRKRLSSEADAEEAASNPVAYAAARVAGEVEFERLMKSGGPKSDAGTKKRGQQDERFTRPFESAWATGNLSMDIYELSEATAVRRATLVRYLRAERRSKEKVGRRYVYGPDAVRRVVKEWLSNPYWYKRSPAAQRDYLKLYLYSTAKHRPTDFENDLLMLGQPIQSVSTFDPTFPNWIEKLRSAFLD